MTALFIQSDGRDMTVWHDRPDRDPEALLTEHEAGPALWAHLMATLPTRDEPQPEPLDPAVRVTDRVGTVWARTADVWVCDAAPALDWDELSHEFGPLTIVTPTPEPTPDERPFKVGDVVKVADDATWDHAGGELSPWRGKTGKISNFRDDLDAVSLSGALVHTRFLTHADAPC